MYQYYSKAELCYVFLEDVPADCPLITVDLKSSRWIEAFGKSRYFSRGWTLQELIAPRYLIFYNRGCISIGFLRKEGIDRLHRTPEPGCLREIIAGTTKVSREVLCDPVNALPDCSVAENVVGSV